MQRRGLARGLLFDGRAYPSRLVRFHHCPAIGYHSPVSKFSIFGELWRFMRVRKKFWLLPLLILIVVLGLLLIFAQASPLAPFIYTII